MSGFLQDVRYAVRLHTGAMGFTLVAVLSLAIGIGGSTTAFSVVNALLIRPLPARDADRLVNVHKIEEGQKRFLVISYPDYQDYRAQNQVLSDFLVWTEASLGVVLSEETEAASGMIVSSNYFSVLGVEPAVGRFFPPDVDAAPGGAPYVVANHGYWRRRLGADPEVVGRTIRVNGQPYTIVGVAPPGFSSTLRGYAPDLFVPLAMQVQIMKRDRAAQRMSKYLKVTGRLRDGVSREEAGAALSVIDAQIRAAHPEREARRDRHGPVIAAGYGSLPETIQLAALGAGALLLAVPGMLLLIACSNVAGMLLARAAARRREIAVRLAVGASRARLVRQLLTESVTIFLMAGAAGTLLAVWLRDLLLALRPAYPIPFELDARFDFAVLAFTLLLSLATGVIFGLVPALQASRANLNDALKDAWPARRRTRVRDAFVIAQISLCMLLLICAGLFTRAMSHAKTLYPGKNPSTVWVAVFDVREYGYTVERSREFFRQLMQNVSAIPGVQSVGLTHNVSGALGSSNTGIQVDGHGDEWRKTESNIIGPGYFKTLGVSLLRGRDLTLADRAPAPPVVIVNESMARRYWPNEEALGRRVRFGETWMEVVGIAENGKFRVAGEVEPPTVYIPYWVSQSDSMLTLLMRISGDPGSVMAALRREVRQLDAGVPIQATMSLQEAVDFGALPLRVAGAAASGFGFIGLLLAAIGIYGLVSYSVAQRTQEIGVRLALGATRGDILGLVLLRGFKLAAIGLGIGVALALATTHVLVELLFGIGPADPLTFVSIVLLLGTTVLVASWAPARRASRVDPMVALRYE